MRLMRPFNREDWMANAGAERGPNGEEPLIYSEETEIIADANGVEVRFYSYDASGAVNGYSTYSIRLDDPFMFIEFVAEGIAADWRLQNPDVLEKLGFEKIHEECWDD